MTNNLDLIPQTEIRSQELSWETVDRMDWQLWSMAILLILVLGIGVLGFMFPSVFWLGQELTVKAPERAFFGFCALLVLAVVYLLQKNAKVRQLKRQLIEAHRALTSAEREADIQSFQALPSLNQFRDALAMEFRRASTSAAYMTVLIFTASRVPPEGLGRMSRQLRSMTRQGESLYRISDNAVGVILPGMKLSNGASFAAQVENICGISKENLEVRITAYPEDASGLAELEGRLRRQD
jgi:hypothetical protein